LELVNTSVSDAGVDRLNALSGLVVVNLYGSHVTQSGIERLKAFGTLEKPTPPVVAILRALTDLTEFQFDSQPLSDVAQYWGERHNIQVVVDGRKVAPLPRDPEPKISADVARVLLRKALDDSLTPLGLEYAIRHEVLFISDQPLRPRMKIAEPERPLPAGNPLREALERPASFEFAGHELFTVLEFVRAEYGVEIKLDERGLHCDEDEESILCMPASLTVRGISLRSALELLFDQLQLRCEATEEALLISRQTEEE
jgi:hypothetical protein